jgi:hypothetical protein
VSIAELSDQVCACIADGRPADAIPLARQAIAADPETPQHHWNLAISLLSLAQWEEGWREFEWGERVFPSLIHNFDRPRWRGESLAGKRILLYCSAGFGDAINFVRYVPLVAQAAAGVVLQSPAELVELFRCIPVEVIARGQRVPTVDFVAPLESMPLRFNTTLQTVPAGVPYLEADPAKANIWRLNLMDIPRPHVGLCWAGSSSVGGRTGTLQTFAPMAGEFISLQKGEASRQSRPRGMVLHDFMSDVRDFSDTAAIVADLDLVITVDTSVAHLAGAMGKPVWMLNPFPSDFRWLLDRADTPWYPTMRIFRQTRDGPAEAVAEMAKKLAELR